MQKVYISLGGNIDPQQHIKKALQDFQSTFADVQCSKVYESESVGFDGDNFLNLVASFDTDLSISQLNDYLHQLEDSEGRERLNGKACDSRTLDLDILLYGAQYGNIEGIELPRQEILEHAHVLMPLVDLAGELIHPQTEKNYSQLLNEADFSDQHIWQVDLND